MTRDMRKKIVILKRDRSGRLVAKKKITQQEYEELFLNPTFMSQLMDLEIPDLGGDDDDLDLPF